MSRMTRPVRAQRKRIRYAVVGLGHIAQVAVLPAFAHARPNSELKALVTDDPTKARRLSRRYGVRFTYSYDAYDQCLKSGEVDAVYITLPNNMHHAYAVSALRAGIHVLCEKPLAISEEECQEMIQAAADSGGKLMTAYRLHFDKANLEAVEVVRSGKLGDPRIFNSTFGMQVRPDNIRLKRDFGGGPLWDMGIYCINAARYLFREEPREVFGLASTGKDKRFREVEECLSAILRFPEGRIATFSCSFGSADTSVYEVIGTKGKLRVDPAYEYAEGLKLTITVDGKRRERAFAKSDQFAPEILYFSDCILKDRQPGPSGKEGLADVRIIRALYRSVESGAPVGIKVEEPEKRPSGTKPKLVRAKSAST